MPPTYQQYTQKNQGIGEVVSEDVYNQAVTKFGKMPNVRKAPDGSYFWTQDHGFGLPTGRNVSVAGTQHSRAATAGDSPTRGLGFVFAPDDIYKEARRVGGHTGTQLGDLYSRGGVLDAFGSQNPADYGMGPARTGMPTRSRSGGMDPTNATTGAQQQVGDFMDWWRGGGPRMEGPLGDIYNTPEGRVFNEGYGDQRIMPGMVGKSFSTNDTLFPERLQSYQLQNGQDPYGPISPMMPPHLVNEAGFGSEDILGGQWGPGQVAASDPSTGSVFNQGANDFYQGQTPGGPYAGFQFPNFFGQPGVFAPGGNGAFNGPDYLNNPGQGGQAGGGFTPTPGTGTGTGDGTFNPNPFPPAQPGGGSGDGGGSTLPPVTPPPAGGGGATLPPPPTTPPPGGFPAATPQSPGADVVGGDFRPAPMQSDASAWLAGNAPDYGYLQQFASESGMPTDVLPAWEAMVQAQQRNIDRKYADLQESFNVSGNRVGTPFGQAGVDFQTQAAADQNALLAQMALGSMESARGRQFNAAGQLAGMAQSGLSQLSGQDFQSAMQQMQNSAGLAGQMYQGSIQGANSLQQTAMQAATQLYGAEAAAGMTEAQRQLALQQMGLDQAGNLSNLWGQNIDRGNQMGMGQYGIQQDQIDRIYNEWLRTRNYNNPLLPYQYAGAMGFQPIFPDQQGSGWLQTLAQIGGTAASAALGGGG